MRRLRTYARAGRQPAAVTPAPPRDTSRCARVDMAEIRRQQRRAGPRCHGHADSLKEVQTAKRCRRSWSLGRHVADRGVSPARRTSGGTSTGHCSTATGSRRWRQTARRPCRQRGRSRPPQILVAARRRYSDAPAARATCRICRAGREQALVPSEVVAVERDGLPNAHAGDRQQPNQRLVGRDPMRRSATWPRPRSTRRHRRRSRGRASPGASPRQQVGGRNFRGGIDARAGGPRSHGRRRAGATPSVDPGPVGRVAQATHRRWRRACSPRSST